MRASALLTSILAIVLGAGGAVAEPMQAANPPKPQPVERRQEAHLGRLTLQPSKVAKQKTGKPVRTPQDWVELADATPVRHGTEFMVVGAQQGSFAQLRINAAKGRTIVRSVRVVFSDGSTKTVKLGTTLTEKGRRFAQVDLGAAKPIAQLEVTTDRQGNGEYTVYGSSGGGSGATVSSR